MRRSYFRTEPKNWDDYDPSMEINYVYIKNQTKFNKLIIDLQKISNEINFIKKGIEIQEKREKQNKKNLEKLNEPKEEDKKCLS